MQESTIHQAATILLVRNRTGQSHPALEVYMTKRPDTMRFLAGHYVFPGGQMDDSDADPRLFELCAPVAPHHNPEGLPLAYWVCALRETFEEAGILLARMADGQMVASDQFEQQRHALLAGDTSFYDIVAGAGLQLATDTLRYFGHRLTPRRVSRKRFDTRYFLALLPEGIEPIPHAGEVAAADWFDPRTALAHHENGQMLMAPPTRDSLRVAGRFRLADEIWRSSDTVGKPTAEELA